MVARSSPKKPPRKPHKGAAKKPARAKTASDRGEQPSPLISMGRGELEALVLRTVRAAGFPEVVSIVLELYSHRQPNWQIARISTSVANTYDPMAIRSHADIRALQGEYTLVSKRKTTLS
jgi:hypothetical protein